MGAKERATSSEQSTAASGAGAARRVTLLDSHTVNQIAAGEVVERPASVVKELVENALDAGARRIAVQLSQAGRELIEVADDGAGMTADDASLALERHATSKIRSAQDLEHVGSLGFRGEALPSIASVSRLELSTGTENGLRSVVRVEGGKARAVAHASGPRGTTVRVEELFFNTPARLKFLKTDATELSACVEVVSKYAIAYPQVAFTLRHGAHDVLRTTGSGSLPEATAEVWGRDVARALVSVDSWVAGVRVRGMVSPPHFTRPTRAQQWVFVNGRPVRSKTITAAVDGAYRSLTPERRFPVVLLLLDADPATVDANVSPTKSEVRFRNEGQAFDVVRQAIRSALLSHGMIPSVEEVAAASSALAGAYGVVESLAPVWDARARDAAVAAQAPLFQPGSGPGLEPPSLDRAPSSAAELLSGLRVLGQAMRTFIVAENERGLIVVDQHVAHERILYERLRDAQIGGPIERQALVCPEPLELDARSAAVLATALADLAHVGFEVEHFGGTTFLVRSVPAALGGRDPLRPLRDLADELAAGGGRGCLGAGGDLRESVWAMCACKMAVKAGDPLGLAEMEKLLSDLAGTENPYLCPHGRPITIVLPRDDLLRRFKRT